MIAIIMVYMMTPGAFELTEDAAHLVGYGDTAHADDDHPSDEHGCSGPYHFCTRHHSVTFVPAVKASGATSLVHASRGGIALGNRN